MSDAFGQTPQQSGVLTALRFDLVLMLLFCVLAVGGTWVVLTREEDKLRDDPVERGARGEVVGATGLSLAAPENLRRAVAAIRSKLAGDEQLTNFRVAPTRVDVIVRNTVGRQRAIQVGLDYDVRVVSDSGTNSSTGPRGLQGIDPAAPARMLATVLARERWSPKTLDYFVYDPPDGDTPARWDAFFVNVPIENNHYTADASGNGAGRPGEQ